MKTYCFVIWAMGAVLGSSLTFAAMHRPSPSQAQWELVLVLPTPNGSESFASRWGSFEDCIEQGFRAKTLGLNFGSCSLLDSKGQANG